MLKYLPLRVVLPLVILLFIFTKGYSQTSVSGSVSGTWSKANSPYVLTGSVTVESGQTLTVEAGVVIESPTYSSDILVYGTLLAEGTSADSIRIQGRANPNGGASSHGGTIYFYEGSSGSVLNYVRIDQMGDASTGNRAVSIDAGVTPTIKNTKISNSELYDIFTWAGGAKNFSNVKSIIDINSGTGDRNAFMPNLGYKSSFYRLQSSLQVNSGFKLTIGAGAVIESPTYSSDILVYGTLLAEGTLADSIRIQGRANPNGGASSHGGTIYFYDGSSGSVLNYVRIDQMGDASTGNRAVSIDSGVTPTIKNTKISNSELYDIFTWAGGAKNFSNVKSIIDINSGTGDRNAFMPNLGYKSSFYRLQSSLQVNSGFKLTIGAGAVIELPTYSSDILVYGTLLAEGTLADSIRIQGRANPNGGASSHGGTIYFYDGGAGSVLSYVKIDQMGDASTGNRAVSIEAVDVKINNCTISNSENLAINIPVGGLSPVIKGNVFARNVKNLMAHPGSCSGISENDNLIVFLLGGTVDKNAVWPKPGNGSYYKMEGITVTVSPNTILEIKPGVIIHSTYYYDELAINGTLIAKGTVADSIRFIGFANPLVSYGYSSHGGRITFNDSGTGSELEYISMDRWGDINNNSYGAIYVNTSGVSIKNSVIRNSEEKGIFIPNGGLSPVITRSVFSGNIKEIVAHPGSCSGISGNDGLVIYLLSGSIEKDAVWPKPGIGSRYQMEGIDVTVSSNTTLKIEPGVAVHSTYYSDALNINGTLIAKGTAADSIRFMGFPNPLVSYGYSSHGGRINFNDSSTGSDLQFVAMDRWGDVHNGDQGAVYINASGVSIKNSVIRNSENKGIYIPSGGFSPVISSNIFANNTQDIVAHPSSVSGISKQDSTIVYLNGNVDKDAIWPKPGIGSYYRFIDGYTIDVLDGITLDIKPGVEIQSHYFADRLRVNGTLKANGTAADSIRFVGFSSSSYSHGGQLSFTGFSKNSELSYVIVDRFGENYYGHNNSAVDINTSDVTIKNSTIRNSEDKAIYIAAGSPQISNNNILDTNLGIYILSGGFSPVISSNIFANNTQDIVAHPSSVSGISKQDSTIVYLNGNVDKDAIWPKPGIGSYYRFIDGYTIDVLDGITLDIKPGVEIQSHYFADRLRVNGTLKANGTAADSIRFVGFSSSNYSHGGQLSFTGSSKNSELSYVIVDRFGENYYGHNNSAVDINTSDVTIKNSTIRNSEDKAIYNTSDSARIKTSNIYNNITGFYNERGKPILTNNRIFNNTDYGINNVSSDTVDARFNDWGNGSGPFHASLNPSGTGNKVSDRVKFIPWGEQDIQVDQIITFEPITNKYLDDTLTLNATTSSELPLTYSIVTVPAGVAVLSGNKITFPADTGRVTIAVKQAGNEFFKPAQVERSFNVYKRNQYITFNSIPFKVVGAAPFVLNATSSSALPVTFTIVSGPATVAGSTLTITGSGTVVVEARQTGNRVYEPAASVQQSFIVYPNTPDLVVQNVTSAQTTVAPDDLVTVNWNVGNTGNASSAIDWTERIYIQSATGEYRTLITQVAQNNNNALTVGQTISRSEQVSIPSQLYVGDQAVFVVELIPNSTIIETPGAQANNTAVQQNAWTIQKVLSLSLSGSEITEGSVNGIAATVYRTGSLAAPLTFNVTLNNPARFSFPASVTIPAGQTGVYFYLSVPDNTTIEATQTDQLKVSASGYQSAQAGLSILDNDMPSLSIANLPASAMEGQSITFRISTNLAPSGPLSVFFQSNNQIRFPVPPSVTIAAGALYTDLTVDLAQDNIPEIDLAVGITAGAANHNPANASIQIKDDDLPNLELVIKTNSISESAGINATQATLRRTSTNNPVAFTANISAGVSNTLILPGAISMAAGENEKTFNIGVIDNNLVDGQRQVAINASIFVASCGCNTPPASAGYVTANLTVNDNDGPTLQLSVVQQTLSEGQANAGLLRITRNTESTNALSVTLSSSDLTEATLPATATIPAGQPFVDVPITTINDNETDGSQQVYFSATASGFSAGSVWVIVTDLNKPDLQISAAQLSNSHVQAASIFNYQVSVKNTGFATAPAGTLVRGYLSLNDVIDASDVLISEDILQEAVPAGQTRILINAAQVPNSPGKYKLLFWANPEEDLIELITTNNKSEPVALTVDPNYTATAVVTAPYFLKGNPIIITGSATQTNGSPVANGQVEVYVITNGIRRNLVAITDASGNFTTQFFPLTSEAGHYQVGASYPGLGQTTEQDAFDILGVSINGGVAPQFRAILNETLTGSLSIENLSSKTINNLNLSPVLLPNGASINFNPLATLPGNASASIQYSVSGSQLTAGNYFEIANFQVNSGEGLIQNVNTYYFCQAENGYLVTNTSNIHTSASQSSGERQIEIMLVNKGKGPTGIVSVNLPITTWLSSVTGQTLPSIFPGDSAVVILKFLATGDVPFNYLITGNIGFSATNGNTFTIPFSFEKVSESSGTAKVTATDQFTYYATGGPKVEGALVTIKNYFTGQVYAEGITGADGIFTANNVPEGRHRITVAKEKHSTYSNVLEINSGRIVDHEAFLSYEAITFSWNVVATAVQDQYDVTLESKFETNVPMPVVTMEMPKTMPKLGEGQVYSFYITATNHGLISAEQLTLTLPDTDSEYEFLTNYVPIDLLPNQSMQIPILMQRRSGFTGGRINSTNGLLCVAATGFSYIYRCAMKHLAGQIVQPFDFEGRCFDNPGGGQPGGGSGGEGLTIEQLAAYYDALAAGYANLAQIFPPCFSCGGGGGSNGNGSAIQPPIEQEQEKVSCVKCIADMAGAVVGCVPIVGEVLGIPICYAGVILDPNNQDILDYGGGLLECEVEAIKGEIIGLIPGGSLFTCIDDILDAIEVCENADPISGNGRLEAQRIINNNNPLRSSNELPNAVLSEIKNNLQVARNGYQGFRDWMKEYFGEMIDLQGWPVLYPLVRDYLSNLTQIPATDQSSISVKMDGYDIQQADLMAFFVRWNRSLEAKANNVFEPNASYPNIINWNVVKTQVDSVISIHNYAVNKGFLTIDDMHLKSVKSLNEIIDGQKEAVCASVTVQFSQQLAMTREAFEGTLEIFNGHPTDAMKNLSVNIQVTDQDGVISNGLFEIQVKSLSNLANVTGSGEINAQQKGSVKYLFIPELGAAPQTPKVYKFGGSITYFDPYAQAMVTLPLVSVPITVNPSPNLMLHYFMQRNVLGDDALTSPEIEPSVPAELAVMVENKGFGPAVNMTISSAQPKIVDNEKGLAINFNLVGSNFQGQPRQLGITDINFGTIPALQTRIGQWYFTSSLLGKFVSYDAKVVHANSFGNPDLSLVQGVKLHELTRSIKLYGTQADGINDFLVNDVFDVNDIPDIIYFSQGNRTQKVNVAASASFNAQVSPPSFMNTLTVTPSDTGFNYIKLDDPGNRLYELVSVTRSDGQVIPLDNAWLTYVTLPVSRSPVYENKFHIVDRFTTNGAATYNVIWKPVNLAVPKVDSIAGAPTQVSSTQIANLRVYFNKRIDPATFNYQDLGLTLQGGANIINSSAVVTQLDTASFNIDLSAITTGNGLYTFTVQAADIKDVYGVSGITGRQVSWSQFLNVPVVQAFQGVPANHVASAYSTINLLFNLPLDVSTVTPARFTIYKNGVLQTGTLAIESVSTDHKLFRLSGLQNILTQDGRYELRVDLPNIKSANNIAGLEIQSVTLTVDKTGPALVHLEKSSDGGIDSQHIPFVNMEFSEGVAGLNISAFSLKRNGIIVPLNIAQLSYVDSKHWSAGNFSTLTYPEGNYTFSVNLANVADSTGNTGAGTQQISWTVDRTALIAVTNVSVSPDLGFSSTDGITSGQMLNVGYNLSSNASQVTISQVDLSGEVVLSNLANVTPGNKSTPVTVGGGGQTQIKVTATGANGIVSAAEKVIYIDQLPLFAQWQFASNQNLITQVNAIPLAFSARLLSVTGLLSAIQLRRNGILLPSTSLSAEVMNDTLYSIKGIRNASTLPGNYELTVNIQSLSKYTSGKTNTGITSVSWTVQSANQAPLANAGIDITVTAPGQVTLNGSASSDPDTDPLAYSWTAPNGIVLTNPTSASPSFTLSEANRGNTYSFLLVVSDGVLFSTDVVVVKFNTAVSFSGLSEKYCVDSEPVVLVGFPTGGTFNGPGISGSTFNPSAAGAGTHTITYTKDGQVFSQSTVVSLKPDLGADKTIFIICNNEKVSLTSLFNTTGLIVQWDTNTPESVGAGKYQLIVTNTGGCKDTAYVTVKQKVATWTGASGNDWHVAANWDTNLIPDAETHVIIPSGSPSCSISSVNGIVASIQIRKGGTLGVKPGLKLTIAMNCTP